MPIPLSHPANHPVGRVPFCVVDIETTGLSPQADEITEIAVVRVDESFRITGELCHLVRTSRPVPWHITRLTGISDSLLRSHGRPLNGVLEEIHDYVGDLPAFAHNARFDRSFLNASAARLAPARQFALECSIPWFKRTLPARKGYGLPVLAEALRVSGGGEHRALGDCRVLLECMRRAHSASQRII